MGFPPMGDFYGPNGPTADMLDGLTDKPIVLADGGLHSYWVNHAAMECLGINKDTPDVSDGIVVRDADGNPTGWFREGAMAYIKPLVVFTVEQMIQAVTLNAARQFQSEDRLGSISVGKEADMVLLERDITTCDPEQIVDTPVLRTMVGGEWVYTH